ncbi:mechanosensitive ion channel [Dyella sp. A6]|uniref:mechanosensitive ion channel n=1 Tax=Dyella aluminiiresistens TaxID=3069105 RepID=UPI002E75D45E|nr:mechanosensitive ion channel [Dyella sp. A6]
MDTSNWSAYWSGILGGYLPHILGALAILVIGWIVALVCRSLTRKALGKLHLGQHLAAHTGSTVKVEPMIAAAVFWIVFLFVLIGVFTTLHIDSVSAPLSTLAGTVMLYLPRLLLAAALAGIAWLVATVVRALTQKALAATGMDRQLGDEGRSRAPLSKTLGQVLFWLIILIFMPAIFSALQIEGLIAPLSDMVGKLLNILPNIAAALLIGGIGWLVARVLRNLVTSLLSSTPIDRLARSGEGTPPVRPSQLCGTITFALVIVPVLIAALDALQIKAIAQPARNMLQMFLDAIPNLMAAAVILVLAWFIGRFVTNLLSQLLSQVGFDRLPRHLGLQQVTDAQLADETAKTDLSTSGPSQVVGRIALTFIMLFAAVEAANRLGFSGVHALLQQLIAFAGSILFGLVILAIGQWLASLAAYAIRRTGGAQSVTLARIAHVAILALVAAMGLHAMGFADSIVNLAFGLLLGAIAVAVALAFGLGGREAAARLTRHWADRYLGKSDTGNS